MLKETIKAALQFISNNWVAFYLLSLGAAAYLGEELPFAKRFTTPYIVLSTSGLGIYSLLKGGREYKQIKHNHERIYKKIEDLERKLGDGNI